GEMPRSAFILLSIGLLAGVSLAALPGEMIINEIMYNSLGADEEWIELFNNSPGDFILDSNWILTDGEGFYRFGGATLEAGGYMTIQVFSSGDFPFIPDVNAEGSGIQLSNASDQVVLRYADLLIDSVEYYDWWGDGGHDGGGYSLERRHPFGSPDDVPDWNSSTTEGGTPGVINSIYFSWGDERPVILALYRSVRAPLSTDTVYITAIAYDDLGLDSVLLWYAVDRGPYNPYPMWDDGVHHDRADGDRIYGATIYPYTHGTTIHYYVVAYDMSAQTDSTEYLGYVINDSFAFGCEVVINEIMYNSIAPVDTEFIELFNRGEDDQNLSGWQITDATNNRFTFPEGTILRGYAYLVVCSDTTEIQSKYGISNLTGNVTFALNNDNDKVLLYDELGLLKDSVEYSDGGEWPSEADGEGPSLELIDAFLDNALPSSWMASIAPEGTPGINNSSTAVAWTRATKPSRIKLYQNNPNPFNASTSIQLSVTGKPIEAKLEILNLQGNLVRLLFQGVLNPGNTSFTWNGLDQCGKTVGGGLYFCRFHSEDQEKSAKMLFLK
ncbi:lamin tail domain-containing protein, partial [bacterium]|nr:lamin tail domain-containing protein [bacterium]